MRFRYKVYFNKVVCKIEITFDGAIINMKQTYFDATLRV